MQHPKIMFRLVFLRIFVGCGKKSPALFAFLRLGVIRNGNRLFACQKRAPICRAHIQKAVFAIQVERIVCPHLFLRDTSPIYGCFGVPASESPIGGFRIKVKVSQFCQFSRFRRIGNRGDARPCNCAGQHPGKTSVFPSVFHVMSSFYNIICNRFITSQLQLYNNTAPWRLPMFLSFSCVFSIRKV